MHIVGNNYNSLGSVYIRIHTILNHVDPTHVLQVMKTYEAYLTVHIPARCSRVQASATATDTDSGTAREDPEVTVEGWSHVEYSCSAYLNFRPPK